MEDIVIRVDAPPELRAKLKLVLSKLAEEIIEESKHLSKKEKLRRFNEIVSKSKLSEEQAEELAKEINRSLHKRYKELYSKLE